MTGNPEDQQPAPAPAPPSHGPELVMNPSCPGWAALIRTKLGGEGHNLGIGRVRAFV